MTNPIHAALMELRRQILADADMVERALAKTDQDMGSGLVWLGPDARSWRDDLGQRRMQVRRASNRLVTAIEEALAGQPAQVSESTADAYRRQRTGRL
ncbi:hypothetical protein [Acrocarpospora catenulata]|uniref:hypothetical protein n=1 Tax=Acrocarpospora catenulata TaxID=2836182 RepID=UPI001BDB5305|nr:hypothetical protein [Acrocarpospora catenulata]